MKEIILATVLVVVVVFVGLQVMTGLASGSTYTHDCTITTRWKYATPFYKYSCEFSKWMKEEVK
jgi:hypothetical protein